MLDFLSPAGIEGLALTAWHTTLVAGLTTVVLFIYTLGLRAATVIERQRSSDIEARWRDVLSRAAMGEPNVVPPRIRRYERTLVLELWNAFRNLVEGPAAESLIQLAEFAGIEHIATRKLDRHRLTSKLLGAQTLGFLHSNARWGDLVKLLDDENTALSATAAAALARINPDKAIKSIMSRLTQRRDWPRNNLSKILALLGSERIREPFAQVLSDSDDDTQAWLLDFAPLLAPDVYDDIATERLRESTDPRVLAGALKLVTGRLDVPRLPWLVAHDVPFVRIQAAGALGRIGAPEHVPLLTRLLADEEWWVRYRAAQALVTLPFLGPNALRRLRDTQEDPYAGDMLAHAMAEADLA